MSVRPGVILVGTIAVAAAAGLAVSFLQRPPPMTPGPRITPVSVGPTPVPRQPSVSFEFSVADDQSSRDVVLFGGFGDLDSTWLWNGSRWSLARPQLSPPGRYGAATAYDPQSGQVLLFGGRIASGEPVSDTWGWDGRNWEQLDMGGTGAPAPGDGADMAWDPAHNQMLLVTPPTDATGPGETWIWNGVTWARQAGGNLGAAFFSIRVDFDPVSQSMIAEGCCVKQSKDLVTEKPSTWRWNGSRWLVLPTKTSPPDGSGMAIDPSIGRLVFCDCNLVGGVAPSLWVWNGEDWTTTTFGRPPTQPQAEVDDVTRSELLVLGVPELGVPAGQPIQVWLQSGAGWRQLDAPAGSSG